MSRLWIWEIEIELDLAEGLYAAGRLAEAEEVARDSWETEQNTPRHAR